MYAVAHGIWIYKKWLNDMELILTRKYFNDYYTIGHLSLDDHRLCDTLEDTVRDLVDLNDDGDFMDSGEGKIYGKTAIPAGRYRIILNYSPKLKRVLPLLLSVPGYTGIRIHKGVTASHTEGCILVGENTEKGRLSNGRYYEIMIITLIQQAKKAGEEIWITIN